MPTPIGHALGGLIVALAARRDIVTPAAASTSASKLSSHLFAAVCAVVACLPDIDFLWGRHNQETHSIGFALIVGVAAYVWKRSFRLAIACTLAVVTHVVFDWLGSDDFPPLGVMALWPFTREYYFADAFVFEAISRRYWLPGFVQHNVLAIARELGILLPITAALWWWRFRPRLNVSSDPPARSR